MYTGCVWMGIRMEERELDGKEEERGVLAGGGAGYTCDKGKYEGLWQVLNGLAPRPQSTG